MNLVKRASSWILGFAPSLILKSQSAIDSINSIFDKSGFDKYAGENNIEIKYFS